jgi:uncharacterized protein (TIGR00251 family)
MRVAWRREETTDGETAIVLTLHVQPGARHTEVAGTHGESLKIRLAAPPIDGKANAELLAFLAQARSLRPDRARRDAGARRRVAGKIVRIVRPRKRRTWNGNDVADQ